MLLSHDDLDLGSEADVAMAGMRWVQYDLDGRRQLIPKVMACVRLVHMTRRDLHQLVNMNPDFMTYAETKQDLLKACWWV